MSIDLLTFYGYKETVGRDGSRIIGDRVYGHVQIAMTIKNRHLSFEGLKQGCQSHRHVQIGSRFPQSHRQRDRPIRWHA